jgi:hypothetical protein
VLDPGVGGKEFPQIQDEVSARPLKGQGLSKRLRAGLHFLDLCPAHSAPAVTIRPLVSSFGRMVRWAGGESKVRHYG